MSDSPTRSFLGCSDPRVLRRVAQLRQAIGVAARAMHTANRHGETEEARRYQERMTQAPVISPPPMRSSRARGIAASDAPRSFARSTVRWTWMRAAAS